MPPPTLIVAPVTMQPGESVPTPEMILKVKVEPTSKVPLAVRVVAPPLRVRAPAPVTRELAPSTWLPPAKFSVAPAAIAMVPVWVPPRLRLKATACTCRVPLLLNGAVTIVLTVPAVRRKSPELLMGVVAAPLRRPSAVMSNVPPARLLNVTPADIVRLPPAQVPAPPLFNDRPSVSPPDPIANTPPLPMVVIPVPFMAPLAQFNVPLTVRLPAPVRVLPLKRKSRCPLALIRPGPFSVSVVLSMARVCVPLAPPTVRLATVMGVF